MMKSSYLGWGLLNSQLIIGFVWMDDALYYDFYCVLG
ncbi:hypothetical protein F889_00211 [Acinetobacter colistiniresistens]|uniref:Uncharacterized protein n=1 Tax=Acinetobacter colistiniresistens TaxID=280145 RepID=N9RBK0_9GAMM|nr:hypothetical protein F889_00211 [Acinetobacter colistiniresistens]